jgi:succinoglycan biosynthesis transport protein ExoP
VRTPNDPFFPDGLPALPADPSGHAMGERNGSGHSSGPGRGLPAPVERRRPPGLASIPDALALLRALRARWLLALTLGVLAAVVAGAAAWRIIPRPGYTASAVIEVKAEKPNLLPGMGQNRPDLKSFQSTQLRLVKSRLVIHAALARPGVAALPTVCAQSDPVDWLADELLVEFPATAELLTISLTGDRPSDIATLVNAVAEAYLEEVVTKDHNERQATSTQLKDLLAQYNAKLTTQRVRLKEMAETVGSDDRQTLALKQQMAVQQLADENRDLRQVQTTLKQLRAELSVLQAAGGEAEPAPIDGEEVEALLDREPAVERLKVEAEALNARVERARRLVRNDGDPSVRAAARALDRVKRDTATTRAALRPKIERELRAVAPEAMTPARRMADLEVRIKVQTAYETILKDGVARLEANAQTFNRNTIDLQWVKDEITQGEEIARQLGKQIESLNVELKAPQRGRLIEGAESPRIESPKKRLAAVGLASLGAFGMLILGVAWREFRLRRVDSPDDMAEGLGLRLVGTLPELPGPGSGRAVPGGAGAGAGAGDGPGGGGWQELLIESIDAARTVILRDCRAEGLRTLLVTSAAKGEGKSSLSGHLAISLARTGRRTLLADFDLRNPSIHKLFGLEPGPGVGELLRGEAEPDDVYHAVADELDVITAGHGDARAIRALGQNALPDLLARMAGRYEFVVIDSAPLLPVADSLLISQHVDAVLLSVYRERSRIPTIFAGYERLAALGVRILGAVVTGVPTERYGEEYHYAAARGA